MSDASDGCIRLELDGMVARIVIDRPHKLGALTAAMVDELDAAAAAIDRASDVRVALLLGTGTKAFCVGADINAWSALPALDMGARWIRDGHRVFDRLATLRQPLIAVLNGMALGGGLELALCADIRIAEDHASFGLPETGIAAIPGWGGTSRLPALIGAARAKQMIFTGERIDATTAERIGLVNEVVPIGSGRVRAEEMAARIAAQAPRAVQFAKQAVSAGQGLNVVATIESLAGGFAAGTADAAEGVAAFRERRPPKFQGR